MMTKPINGIMETDVSYVLIRDMSNLISREPGPRLLDLYLYGPISSKKNRYTPTKGGMHKGTDLKDEINALIQQVPGDMRDLCLEHPDIIVKFCVKNNRKDRDGMLANLLDILVACKVIEDDSIRCFNGAILILPAEIVKESESVHVRISPK